MLNELSHCRIELQVFGQQNNFRAKEFRKKPSLKVFIGLVCRKNLDFCVIEVFIGFRDYNWQRFLCFDSTPLFTIY